MSVYQLELKSKLRLMCEGEFINIYPSESRLPRTYKPKFKRIREG